MNASTGPATSLVGRDIAHVEAEAAAPLRGGVETSASPRCCRGNQMPELERARSAEARADECKKTLPRIDEAICTEISETRTIRRRIACTDLKASNYGLLLSWQSRTPLRHRGGTQAADVCHTQHCTHAIALIDFVSLNRQQARSAKRTTNV
jgi:hypothetical protein